MAARKNLTHVQKTRDRIQASMLINRLTEHALSETDIMSASQVNAAKILIGKVIPDVKQTELTGQDGSALQIIIDGKLKDV